MSFCGIEGKIYYVEVGLLDMSVGFYEFFIFVEVVVDLFEMVKVIVLDEDKMEFEGEIKNVDDLMVFVYEVMEM